MTNFFITKLQNLFSLEYNAFLSFLTSIIKPKRYSCNLIVILIANLYKSTCQTQCYKAFSAASRLCDK